MVVRKFKSSKLGRDVWGYDARIGNRRRQKIGFSTKSADEEALARARSTETERRAGIRPPPEKPSVTVKALVERRVSQLQGSKRRKVSAGVIERWLNTLPAGLLVTELATAHLQAYQDERLKVNKPQSVFREMTDVCSMLNRARDLFPGLDSWVPPRRPRLKTPTGGRDRVITPDEASRILGELRRPREDAESEGYYAARLAAADLLQIALFTAARRWEILSLRWTDVNFEWATLRVVGTKTDRVRVVPMTGALVRLLERRKAEAGKSPLVFPALEGTTLLRYNTDQLYRAASQWVGIPYGRSVPGGWVLHDARHTAITAMLHAGNSLESVMAISGHSARVMAMRYAHSNESTRRAAVSALDQFAA